jgi:hypothetical protein
VLFEDVRMATLRVWAIALGFSKPDAAVHV